MCFNEYHVVEEKKGFFYGIYFRGTLVASATSWKASTKKAKLLAQAYCVGCNNAKEYIGGLEEENKQSVAIVGSE